MAFGGDSFVNSVLKPVLVLIFVIMIAANALIVAAFYNVIVTARAANALTEFTIAGFSYLRGAPSLFGGPILQMLPAVVSVLCFAKDSPTLSWTGRAVFILDIMLVLSSGLALAGIHPEDPSQTRNFPGGVATAQMFHEIAQASFTASWVYFGLLTGLSFAQAEKISEGEEPDSEDIEVEAPPPATDADSPRPPGPEATTKGDWTIQLSAGPTSLRPEELQTTGPVEQAAVGPSQAESAIRAGSNRIQRSRPARAATGARKRHRRQDSAASAERDSEDEG